MGGRPATVIARSQAPRVGNFRANSAPAGLTEPNRLRDSRQRTDVGTPRSLRDPEGRAADLGIPSRKSVAVDHRSTLR